MNLEDNELWQAFNEEVQEQLERLEVDLVNLEDAGDEDINQLFRNFHSIKSSAAMFEFLAMEEIAHAAEDILDQVRNRITEANQSIINILLASVDCLKDQLSQAAKTMQAPERNQKLLEELLTFKSDEAPTRFDENEVETNALGIDPVEMEEFAEMVEIAMVNFFASLEKNDKDKAVKSLSRLARASEILEFSQLVTEINRLISLVENNGFGDNDESLAVGVRVIDQFLMLEELSEQTISLASLYPGIASIFAQGFKKALGDFSSRLAAIIDVLEKGDSVDPGELEELCVSNEQVFRFFKVQGLYHSCDLYRYFNQVTRKAVLGHVSPDLESFKTIYQLTIKHAEAASDYEQSLQIDGECKDVQASFRQSLSQKEDDGFHRVERIATLTALLDIEPDYMDYTENSEIELLEYYVKEKKTIAVMVVDIEADQEWARAFVEWLNNHEVITSRTILCKKHINGKEVEYTKTSFLVVFEQDEDAVRESLEALGDSDNYIEKISFKDLEGGATRQYDNVSDNAVKALGTNQAAELETNKTIRVNSDAIDRFVAQVGEMVLQRNMVSHAFYDKEVSQLIKRCRSMLATSDADSINEQQLEEIKDSFAQITDFLEELEKANQKLSESVSFVQDDVMSLRVVPISIVFNRLPRVVRNINVDYGKDIRLKVRGESVRVDKSMVDVLMEPLVHIVRNCADHGIETSEEREANGKTEQAMISVSAEQTGSFLNIEISDNGKGLDFRKIREKAIEKGMLDADAPMREEDLKKLIFQPGFSTSEKLTETSGRGVGMDVVRNRIAAIGGAIDVRSVQGVGTSFTLKLPVSAAIQGVVLFSHKGETLCIPERNVIQGINISRKAFQSVQGQAAFVHQDEILPLYSVSELLQWSKAGSNASTQHDKFDEQEVLVITDDNYHIGLVVDKVIDRQEIFVRDLHSDLMSLPGVGGASILGNGEVVIILDAVEILQIASKNAQNLKTLLNAS